MIKYIIDDWDLNEFNPDDVVGDISDDALSTEYKKRFEKKLVQKPLYIQLQEGSKLKLHDFLADLTNLQHTCSKDQILNELSNMI